MNRLQKKADLEVSRTKKPLNSKKQENFFSYIFLTPWLLGLLIFTLIPMFSSLYLSLSEYDMFTESKWVGMGNYAYMFTNDSQFWNSLTVTFKYVFLTLPLELGFALFIAIVLKKGIKGLRIYRAVYYIPSLFGTSVAIALLWRQVFGIKGLVNQFLGVFGIQGVSWIANPDYSLYTLVLLKVWQFGAPMLIFLAGLQQIPADYYEAASIDGANKWKSFRAITLPLLTPIVLFNMIMQIIKTFQSFTPAFIISGGTGGPADSLMFYTLYLYMKGFNYFQMGYASALAWVLLLIIAFFTGIVFKTSDKWVFYSE